MPELSIILPTFTEQVAIIPLIQAIETVLSDYKKGYEIIIVDDNSPDGTGKLVTRYAKNHSGILIFTRTTDFGLGKAIGFGIKQAKGKIIIGMDADFNHPPESIPAILAAVSLKTFVVASRFIKGGGMVEQYRYWLAFGFNLLLHQMGFPSTDNTSGFYSIYKKDLLALPLPAIYYGYGDYHLRLVYAVKQAGYSLVEVPVVYGKRRGGVSKSRFGKMAYGYFREAWRLKSQSDAKVA